MRFVTGVSLSFDIKLQAACSINRLNIIYFKTGDCSRLTAIVFYTVCLPMWHT